MNNTCSSPVFSCSIYIFSCSTPNCSSSISVNSCPIRVSQILYHLLPDNISIINNPYLSAFHYRFSIFSHQNTKKVYLSFAATIIIRTFAPISFTHTSLYRGTDHDTPSKLIYPVYLLTCATSPRRITHALLRIFTP